MTSHPPITSRWSSQNWEKYPALLCLLCCACAAWTRDTLLLGQPPGLRKRPGVSRFARGFCIAQNKLGSWRLLVVVLGAASDNSCELRMVMHPGHAEVCCVSNSLWGGASGFGAASVVITISLLRSASGKRTLRRRGFRNYGKWYC